MADPREILSALRVALTRHEAATDAMTATAAGDDPHAAALAGIELEKANALLSTWAQPEYLRALIDCTSIPAPAEGDEPLFLLHCGQIDSDGEQDEWETQADSYKRVEEFCRLHPGKTIKLYPHVQPKGTTAEARLTREARVGGTTFGINVPERLVIEAAQRAAEHPQGLVNEQAAAELRQLIADNAGRAAFLDAHPAVSQELSDLIGENEHLREQLAAVQTPAPAPEDRPACNPHPKAPHGFNRGASHTAGRYVCDCDGWDAWGAGYEAGFRAGLNTDEAAAPAVVAGLSPSQEPKYTVNGHAIVNRASGEAIPPDEPVFIFRARDAHAMYALRDYLTRLPLGTSHRKAVEQRVMDFFDFKAAHPERMKEPDTEPASHVPVQGTGESRP